MRLTEALQRVRDGRARLESTRAMLAKLDADQAVNRAQAEKGGPNNRESSAAQGSDRIRGELIV